MYEVKRETAERQRETEMKSAGAQPRLYMHGWWKNVSLNGFQLSTALRTAKTSQGNKIWHHYYYTAILNYPLAFTVSLFRSNARALKYRKGLKRARFYFFPWKPRRIRGEQKTHEGTCRGKKHTIQVITRARTLLPVQHARAQCARADRRICAL